jgi:XRE family aerobic/anaerobic benzoate catabolism transcriptional regulator
MQRPGGLPTMPSKGLNVASKQTRSPEESCAGPSAGAVPRGGFPYPESEFLRQLGERVRNMRILQDMSRRELSRRSGVSERYIAQIEKGEGNVSIVLLLRIAHAVRYPSDISP